MLETSALQIKLIRKYLKVKILEDNITFRGNNLERQHVYELMRKTVVNGESHSALIVGARGSGKTTLINSVLSQLAKEVDVENDVIIVRLSGLLHHDDKVALKAITAQRERQEECILIMETFPALTEVFMSAIEGRIEETMTVIEKYVIILYDQVCARLSTNAENTYSRENTDNLNNSHLPKPLYTSTFYGQSFKGSMCGMQLENSVAGRVFGSFAENISFLIECLQSGKERRCRSMLYILDELHMFAHSGRTQALLYNLFDITQSGTAPMCVIGVTSRLDVLELLEKRVKSRFSHRHINLYPTDASETDIDTPKSTLKTYIDIFTQLLTVPLDTKDEPQTPKKKKMTRKKSVSRLEDLKIDESTGKEYSIPKEVLDRCAFDLKKFSELDKGFAEDWNAHVKALSMDQKVIDAIEKFCYFTVNQQIFRDVLFQIIGRLSPTKPYIDASDICATIDNAVAPEHRVSLLQSLSILELSLVIAMKHGLDIFDGQPMNFEMILHRYTKFANAHSSAQTVPRPVILKAFEHLQALEIIMPVRGADSIYSGGDSNLGRVQKEYQWYTLAVPTQDIDDAIKGFKALPTEINHWYTNSVV